MTVYVVVDLEATDPELLNEYRGLAKQPLLDAGATILAGGPNTVLEAHNGTQNLVIFSFPSQEAAEKWYYDPALAEIHAMRHKASKSSMAIVPAF